MANAIAKKIINEELNGIEIYFNVYPLTATRETLKKNGFRWNHKKGCWYARYSMTADSIADTCADCTIGEYKTYATANGEEVREIVKKTGTDANTKREKKTQTKTTVNKYGIKVGDYFSMSWGYDQTNVDYFQVIELVGSCSARIKEVYPEIIQRDPTCSMAEDRVYKLDRSKIAPCATSSVFIDDCEKGDLKQIRLSKYYSQDDPRYYISFDKGYYHAYLCKGETEKQYVSWYA